MDAEETVFATGCEDDDPSVLALDVFERLSQPFVKEPLVTFSGPVSTSAKTLVTVLLALSWETVGVRSSLGSLASGLVAILAGLCNALAQGAETVRQRGVEVRVGVLVLSGK